MVTKCLAVPTNLFSPCEVENGRSENYRTIYCRPLEDQNSTSTLVPHLVRICERAFVCIGVYYRYDRVAEGEEETKR